MNMLRSVWGLAAAGILLAFAALLINHAGTSLDRSGARTVGVVERVYAGKGPPLVEVRYQPPGSAPVTFQHNWPHFTAEAYPDVGQPVAVAYNPEEPEEARIPGHMSSWAEMLIFGAAAPSGWFLLKLFAGLALLAVNGVTKLIDRKPGMTAC